MFDRPCALDCVTTESATVTQYIATKQLQPRCKVFGVEPEGADSMRRSFEAGAPVTLASTRTIADSLAPPMALPFGFAACRRYVDDIVTVSDDEIRGAMRVLFEDLKLALEPAGLTIGQFGLLAHLATAGDRSGGGAARPPEAAGRPESRHRRVRLHHRHRHLRRSYPPGQPISLTLPRAAPVRNRPRRKR